MASNWRIHPLVAEEAGAVFGDAVAAHQADGFAHHAGAVAGVPELGGGAEDVGDGIEEGELDQRVQVGRLAPLRRYSRASFCTWRMALNVAVPPAIPRAAKISFFCVSSGSSWSNSARGRESQRGAGFAGGPDIHQAVHHVLLSCKPELVARRAGGDCCAAAEPAAVVADDRLDGGEQLGRGHDGHRDARAAEDGFDDLAVAVARDDRRRP